MARQNLNVVKIGGNVIDNADSLNAFLNSLATIKEPLILVHGGGKLATEIASSMGVPQKMINGRRVTDKETLKIATMVYAGYINKNIVARLQAIGVNAIGLSGPDGNIISTTKRPAFQNDFGYVGDLHQNSINTSFLLLLLKQGLLPVFSAITHDQLGQLLNTNADGIASALSTSVVNDYDVRLYYCFEKKGVLSDEKDEGSVIGEINRDLYAEMKANKSIHSGMIPKLDTAFAALQVGVKEVRILHPEDLANIIENKGNEGTVIKL